MSINAKRNSRRKRFDDEQIKSLETTFEAEARPELHMKQHLADKLGLQPRQVAIWFQNKRARSKSKQIEGEYGVLKSSYDDLALQLEELRRENQTLLIQVQKLRKMADDNEEKKRMKLEIESDEVCMPLCGEEGDVWSMGQIGESSFEKGWSLESCVFLDSNGGSGRWWEF